MKKTVIAGLLRLSPDETELFSANYVQHVIDRIAGLIANDLEEIAASDDGQDTLLRDPEDGRLWELTWPAPEETNLGPPRLAVISLEVAKLKYFEALG